MNTQSSGTQHSSASKLRKGGEKLETLKILLISTQALPVYPVDYGGLEALVGDLSIGLTKLGHEVTVVTTKHSSLPKEVNVIECCEPSMANPEREAYAMYKDKLKEYDIIHDHSVAYEETILVKEDGRFKRVCIGEWVDELMKRYGYKNEGDSHILHLPKEVETFTLGNDFKMGLAPVTAVIRHKAPKEIYELKLEGNLRIRVTGDHTLFVLDDDGNIKPISARDSEGKFLATPTALPCKAEDVKHLHFFENLNAKLYVEIGNIKEEIQRHRKTILRELLKNGEKYKSAESKITRWKRKGYIPLKYFKYLNANNAEGFLRAHKGAKIPFPLPLTDEFLLYCGLWLADGCYDTNGVKFACANDLECAEVVEHQSAVFGASVRRATYRPDVNIQINSKCLKEVMKAIGFVGDARTKFIPNWIFNLSERQIGLILKGYFSGDGSIYERTQDATLRSGSASKTLTEDVRLLLLRLGIFSRLGVEKGGGFSRGNSVLHVLYVPQTEFAKFRDKVGFLQFKSVDTLTKNCVNRESWHGVVPRIKLLENLAKLGGSKHARRFSLQKLVEMLPKVREAQAFIEKIINAQVIWLKVKSVRKIPYNAKYLYDLSVPNTERFFCSGLVVHNSWRAYCYLYKMNEDPDIKIIKTIHGMLPFRSAPPVKTPNLVGVSKSHALFLASQLGVATRYVYNGIQTERFDWTKAERGERYLHLNRIQPIKGAMQFVDLMLKTRSFGDVVGDDSVLAGHSLEEIQYIERVREKCDGHFVRYFGKVSHERKMEFLRKCKAVICLPIPSYCEVFGLSCLEGLAFGKPAIVLRTPGFFSGLAEIVEHGKSGFIAESLDEVEKLIRDDAVSSLKPEDCRKRAEQFDYMVMAKNYLELYREALSSGW